MRTVPAHAYSTCACVQYLRMRTVPAHAYSTRACVQYLRMRTVPGIDTDITTFYARAEDVCINAWATLSSFHYNNFTTSLSQWGLSGCFAGGGGGGLCGCFDWMILMGFLMGWFGFGWLVVVL